MHLVVKQNDRLVNQIQFIKGPIYLGRHAQSQVFLPDRSVSRQHAVIFLAEERQWMVKDLHSANKTFLNGKAIVEAIIETGDRIQVGDYVVEVDLEKNSAANKLIPLEDTHAPASRSPQLIKRTLEEKHAPAIRMPAHRANDLHQILRKVAHARGSLETLEVLLEVLVHQFHAGRVWCSFRYDTQGIVDEQGGRTDTGESFELQGEAVRKLIEKACDNRQFLLLLHAKQEAGRVQAQSIIIVPIVTDEGTLGVININSKPDRAPFTMSDLASVLAHFTGEVGNIRVAAIDREGLRYNLPVDIVINQYDPKSWMDATKAITARAHEAQHPTIVLLQHEYGLDPDPQGHDGEGSNFVNLTRACGEAGLTRLVYLHTVLDDPDEYQKETIQQLAYCSDGLVVTTENAIETLAKFYGIERNKLKHIDHGIRMEHPSQHDRLAIKDSLGLKRFFLATTVGMLSPDKGIQYAIEGYGRFLNASLTEIQRRQMIYLVAGSCHPEFMRAEGGEPYREYKALLKGALDRTALRWCNVKNLRDVDYTEYDVVFLDTFLDEATLLRLYAATNAMLLPYLNMQQISSGILADTLGSGRVVVSTKFKYALELIHSNKRCPFGVVIGRHARGILVDPAEPNQIAEALDYLVFHCDRRLQMERQAHQRGYQMRWQNSAWAILQHVEFLQEQKRLLTGRGVRFKREHPSTFHRIRRAAPRENGTAQNELVTQATDAVSNVRIKET